MIIREVIIMYRRVRDMREDKDMAQWEMAKVLHCSQRVYSNYECGDVKMPIDVFVNLANFHNTSIDYLVELTDEKMPYPRKR